MGIEYKIQFAHRGAESVASVLRRLPMILEVSAVKGFVEFRAEQTRGTMPDATVSIEPDGLYFCDCGGAGKQFLGILIAHLVSEFDPVTVVDWE